MNKDEALERAAVLAMRDAAALMIMKFDKVTRISELADEAPVTGPASTPDPADEDLEASPPEDKQDETT